jgi:hypothetical protein
VLALLRSLPSKSLRTSLPSPLSAIPAIQQRQDLDVVEPSLEDGANVVDVPIRGAGADNSSELEDEVVNRVTIIMIIEGAEVVRVVVDDSDGRTMISHSAIGMRLLISSLTGRCWRRSISTVLLS